MKQISGLLEKFTKLAQSSDDAKQAVVSAVVSAGVKIPNDIRFVTIRGQVATLRLSPIQKSEVSLKQKKIIELLSKGEYTKNIKVVR